MRQLYLFFEKQKWSPLGTKLSLSYVRELFCLKEKKKNSLIILSKINGKNILFMEDANVNNKKRIINEYYFPKIDILKIGHHSSNTSISSNFLDYIISKYAIISVGMNNRYNHP